MKNFLIGLFSGFLVAGLVAVILVFVLIRVAASVGEKRPTVAGASTLIVKLEGTVPEKPGPDIPLPFLEDQSPASLPQVWGMFRKAATDPKIKAIVIEPRNLLIGWAQMEEIRHEMETFRKSGKPLVAFLRNPGSREYYLATAADRIYMAPQDTLDLKGLHLEAAYFKNTLDKIGAKMEVVHAGAYKDAYDPFIKTGMSPETREVLNQVLDQLYGDMVSTIASGRKKQPEEIKADIDQGPFEASQAQALGLVDALGFEDLVSGDLQKRLNQSELKKVSHKTYIKSLGAGTGKRIALIVGQGEIVPGNDNPGGFGSDSNIVSGAFIKQLRDVENDSSIKGAIIRVDSPGGEGTASDAILHEAKILSKKKPVVISMGDLAASGGYFISMTGDPIVAYPNTITGSIGVIYGKINLHGFYDKIGVNKQLLSRGRYADLDSDYAPLTDDDRKKLEKQIDDFYHGFLSRVSEGRRRPVSQIEPIAGGHVWMGAAARKNGLVDELGGLDRALELVEKRAGISPSEAVTLVPFPPKRSLFDMLLARQQDDSAAIDIQLKKILGGLPVTSWRQGGFLELLPYTLSVR